MSGPVDEERRFAQTKRNLDEEITVNFAELPSPTLVADALSKIETLDLLTAHDSPAYGWRVNTGRERSLRSLGLVEAIGPGLTAFGLAVYREVLRLERVRDEQHIGTKA